MSKLVFRLRTHYAAELLSEPDNSSTQWNPIWNTNLDLLRNERMAEFILLQRCCCCCCCLLLLLLARIRCSCSCFSLSRCSMWCCYCCLCSCSFITPMVNSIGPSEEMSIGRFTLEFRRSIELLEWIRDDKMEWRIGWWMDGMERRMNGKNQISRIAETWIEIVYGVDDWNEWMKEWTDPVKQVDWVMNIMKICIRHSTQSTRVVMAGWEQTGVGEGGEMRRLVVPQVSERGSVI